MKQNILIIIVCSLLLVACGGATGNVVAEKSLEIKGSDTLLQLVASQAEAFGEQNPELRISVTGGGSGTGIASLLNGEVKVADSSRRIKDEELLLGEQKGLSIKEFIIARDMLSVIVHVENPVRELTIEDVSAIYRGEIRNWNELGGPDAPISLYGRQSTSGTYVFFMEEVVQGEYSPNMRNMEGNQAILEAARQDRNAIGYVGLGYLVDQEGNVAEGVGVVAVGKGDGQFYSPLAEDLSHYPISRPLYQYVTTLDEPIGSFIRFELSETGQQVVERSGFARATAADRTANAAAGIES